MESDRRSFRVALVADPYVNPPADGFDALAVFEAAGWGVIQLPADIYTAEVADALLVEIAEQAEEFFRHGYDLVLVGCRQGLGEALAAVAMELPPQVVPASPEELFEFLRTRPAPAAVVGGGAGETEPS